MNRKDIIEDGTEQLINSLKPGEVYLSEPVWIRSEMKEILDTAISRTIKELELTRKDAEGHFDE